MPLTIDLKHGDRMIINGAVIEMASPNSKIIVHNEAAILRGKEIMQQEDARTPAARVYFSLQGAYIFKDKEQEFLEAFDRYLADFLKATPSSLKIVQKIKELVEKDQIYKALKEAHALIEHEENVLKSAGIDVNSFTGKG
ncbi:flagellar biosynthesis repressor FlbT [Terasakiella sp. A23]|uniref:flagellar biosynthesis repressor FlbT n=1 Tax=Terasakiella sp. FCG-A23 TaxID=3080561 RepID=UPI0029533ED7|nr:flagellar biosynthesis repressor FlbT [Terasakiella sp. A23]MDV7339045.1 flagellar biosynthesis repressor FlbT [Terasakiella sp. A23]